MNFFAAHLGQAQGRYCPTSGSARRGERIRPVMSGGGLKSANSCWLRPPSGN